MDEAFDQLIRPSTVVYGACIIILTFIFRRFVETTFPILKQKVDDNAPVAIYENLAARYWNQVILYMLCPAFGAFIGLLDVSYFYASDGPATRGGRVFMGIFIGGAASFIYKLLKKRWGLNVEAGLRPSDSG